MRNSLYRVKHALHQHHLLVHTHEQYVYAVLTLSQDSASFSPGYEETIPYTNTNISIPVGLPRSLRAACIPGNMEKQAMAVF